ncbi:hypothetical protein CHS0354_026407 [Potamilus streckersoni]|uniref:Mitochondria-eating protein C-terminal domain-containing protein n=1 Tax=Potamilus streckersoni TaxID=2493646 RepID=A0AAE0W5I7_9BIVA|nr:hypothetical protein CHS0354_026407 [Potamilus streckersoni]
MSGTRQTASSKNIDLKSNNIDHIAEILKQLQKDKNYKGKVELAINQWNSTMEEIEQLRLKKETKSAEQNVKREQEKDMRIFSLEQQVKELTLRLSTIAGDRMLDKNSDITDLSDPYRPTKLAEMFKEVYNEEWTDAFHYYDSLFRNEDKVLDSLSFFPKDIYDFCRELFKQQSEQLEGHMQYMFKVMTELTFKINSQNSVCAKKANSTREASKEIKDEGRILVKKLQKSMAKSSASDLFKLYIDVASFGKKTEWTKHVGSNEALKKFISRLLELIWLMMSQDPPIVLKSLEPGTKIDKASFVFYTKSGDIVRRTVWPAVYLTETGPLMSKGVIQTI